MPAPGDALLEAARVPHPRAETVRALRGVNLVRSPRTTRVGVPFLFELPHLLLPEPAPQVLSQERWYVGDGRAPGRNFQLRDEQFRKLTPTLSLSRRRFLARDLPRGFPELRDQ